MGPAGPQQQMNVLPPVGEGATQGTTSGSSLGNPLPGRSTSAGPKISLPAGSVGKEIQVGRKYFFFRMKFRNFEDLYWIL